MSGPAINARAPVDLEDFEARLRGSAPGGAPQTDPLAELARLVEGRRMPFAPPPAPQNERLEPFVAQRDQPYGAEPRQGAAYGQPARVSGGWDAHGAGEDFRAEPRGAYGPGDAGVRYAQPQEPYPQQAYAPEPVAQQAAYAPTPPGAWRPEEAVWEDQAPQAPARKSRKGLYALGGALCVLLAGVAGTMAYRGNPLVNASAPTIKAATGPMKVTPEAPAPSNTPTNSASVLDKAGEKIGASRVVTSEEQPVDLSQVRTASIPAAGSPARAGSAFPDPIKVKTVSVRPDGTIISSSDAAAKPAQPATTSPTPQRTASNVTGSTPPAITTAPAPAAPKPAAAAATPKVTARVTPPADSVDALIAGRPAAAPAPTAAGAAPLPAVAKGGFAVQLAAAGTDAEARDKVGKLQRQYASALDGKPAGVVKGEANGKQVWRIRVGGLSREEATSMCVSIKDTGGACFVAAN